jgi:hypothetical protein
MIISEEIEFQDSDIVCSTSPELDINYGTLLAVRKITKKIINKYYHGSILAVLKFA